MAADLRAPTPSAAMELIVPDRREVLDRIGALIESAEASLVARLILARGTLDHLTRSPALKYPDRLLLPRLQALDNLESRLAAEFEGTVSRCEARLGEVSAGLASLSPLGVLSRGYGIVRRPDGRVVTRISDTGVGETIDVLISDGRIISEVRETRKGWD
jgi:exodeoxyribonuclease VII large subunit